MSPDGPWRLEEPRACPLCDGAPGRARYDGLYDRIFRVAGGPWRYVECRRCASLYLAPRPTAETIGAAYASYYTHTSPEPAPHASQGRWERLRRGYLNSRYGYALPDASPWGRVAVPLLPHRRALADRSVRHLALRGQRRLLDVGCGAGAFLVEMRRMGWEVEGLEVDPRAAATARESGISVVEVDLAALAGERRGHYDAVTFNHALEHLHDPVDALRKARELLAPGGVVWVATPNAAGLAHRWFREDWVGLDAPRHVTAPTPRGLLAAFRRAGFARPRLAPPAPAAATPFTWMSLALRRGADASVAVGPTQPRDLPLVKALEWVPLAARRLSDEAVVLAEAG